MIPVTLSHNPYLIKTEITIDGEKIIDGPLHERAAGKRLQLWLEDIFPGLVSCCNDNQLKVSFFGTVADYHDLMQVKNQYVAAEDGATIELVHIAGGESDPSEKISALKLLFEEAKKGPIEEFHDEELDREFYKALDPNFEVSVIATMSAGKSTLINALIGADLLPAKNEACTATVTYISDHDDYEEFFGRAINDDGKPQCDWTRITPELLSEWNKENVRRVEMQGNIPMIASDNVRLVLVDTPGPNNSRNARHQECTIGMIKDEQKPMVLYVLNATQLSTNDDHALLSIVAKEMSRGGKQSHDRFIFAVNKIDQLDPEKESIPRALENVKTYLEENGIKNPNIYPVSALITKLIRQSRKGDKLTRQEQSKLIDGIKAFTEDESMQMLQYMPASPSVKRIVHQKIASAESMNDHDMLAMLAMLHSGIPVVEESIQEYMRKYALPAKIYDAKASFEVILERRATLARIDDELQKNAAEREAVHFQMLEIQLRMEKGEEAKKFQQRLQKVQWVKSKEYEGRVKPIRDDIIKQISKLQTELRDDVSPDNAHALIKNAMHDASIAVEDIQKELEKIVKTEALDILENLRREYQQYVQELMGNLGELSLAMNQFKALALVLPSAEKMIANHTETLKVEDGSHSEYLGEWRNPFSWLKWEDVTDYRDEEYVDLSKIAIDIGDEIRGNFANNFNTAEELAKQMVGNIREQFLEQMTGINAMIAQMVEDMANKTESKDALEEAIQENAAKRAWLEDFQRRLDAVLSIDGVAVLESASV